MRLLTSYVLIYRKTAEEKRPASGNSRPFITLFCSSLTVLRRQHQLFMDPMSQTPSIRTITESYSDFSSSCVTFLRSYQWKSTDLTLVIVGVCTMWIMRSALFTTRRFFKDQYPPGPKAIPLFGNVFQLSMDAWVPFTKWKKQYGESHKSQPC